MTSSGDFYSSFHNILNPTVTVLGKIGLEYVDSSGKQSDLFKKAIGQTYK